MEQSQYLSSHIFTGLKNLNDGFDEESVHHFSAEDFELVLERVEHSGIGVHKIDPWLEGKLHGSDNNEKHRKKATDSRWYKKAFKTFKMGQEGLTYSATFSVSKKLLAR